MTCRAELQINHRWKLHRDDWRVKLAMLTGTNLVAPSYVPDDDWVCRWRRIRSQRRE